MTAGVDRDLRAERAFRHLQTSADVKRAVAEQCLSDILSAAELVLTTFRSGGTLFLCGNGGSAADCQHMATEFVSRLSRELERPGLPAVALTTDTSFLTAFSNDCGFEGIFERQIRALARRGDALLGISTSGSSANVVHAFRAAREREVRTIALVGGSRGQLNELADVAIMVPSTDTQRVQEAHLVVEHIICDLVEQSLYGVLAPNRTRAS